MAKCASLALLCYVDGCYGDTAIVCICAHYGYTVISMLCCGMLSSTYPLSLHHRLVRDPQCGGPLILLVLPLRSRYWSY